MLNLTDTICIGTVKGRDVSPESIVLGFIMSTGVSEHRRGGWQTLLLIQGFRVRDCQIMSGEKPKGCMPQCRILFEAGRSKIK